MLRRMGDLRFFIEDRVRLVLRTLLWLKKVHCNSVEKVASVYWARK